MEHMTNVTEMLAAIASGNGQTTDALLPLVYDELRRLAVSQMAKERPGMTLDATGLAALVDTAIRNARDFVDRYAGVLGPAP